VQKEAAVEQSQPEQRFTFGSPWMEPLGLVWSELGARSGLTIKPSKNAENAPWNARSWVWKNPVMC